MVDGGSPPAWRKRKYPPIHAETTPDKAACVMAGRGEVVTYRELEERSNRAAQLFRSLGLRPGDAIAFCIENHPRFFEIAWAAQRLPLRHAGQHAAHRSRGGVNPRRLRGARVHHHGGETRAGSSAARLDAGASEPLHDRRDGAGLRFVRSGRRRPSAPVADETEGQDMLYPSGPPGRPKSSVGRALLGEMHVVGPGGGELPNGEIGAVYFAAGVPFESHNDPEKTAGSRHEKGWSTLGDIGTVDEEGYLYLADRKANTIISGGVNIYPQEAEDVLITHPRVADVAVFGVPNQDLGEEVKAVVQPIDMREAGPEFERELIAFCQQHLARFQCPRSIDFDEELPRHPTGKLYKRLLKDRYWKGHASRII